MMSIRAAGRKLRKNRKGTIQCLHLGGGAAEEVIDYSRSCDRERYRGKRKDEDHLCQKGKSREFQEVSMVLLKMPGLCRKLNDS